MSRKAKKPTLPTPAAVPVANADEVLDGEHFQPAAAESSPDEVGAGGTSHPQHPLHFVWKPTAFTWLLIGLTALVCLLGGYIVYYNRATMAPVASTATYTTRKAATHVSEHITGVAGVASGSMQYSAEPVAMDNLHLLKTDTEDERTDEKSAQYYKLGTNKGGDTLFALVVQDRFGFTSFGEGVSFIGVQKANKAVFLLVKHSPRGFYQTDSSSTDLVTSYTFFGSVTFDQTTTLTELTVPTSMAYKSGSLIRPSYSTLGFSRSAPDGYTLLGDAPQGKLYEYDGTNLPKGYNLRGYALRTKDSQWYGYLASLPEGFQKADGSYDTSQLKFTAPALAAKSYSQGAFGCGSIGTVSRMAALDVENTTQIGTIGGGPLYALNETNPLTIGFYKDYEQLVGYIKDSTQAPDGISLTLTEPQFAALPGVIGFHDSLGNLVIMSAKDYRTPGGCAKPVIYLYPTKPTTVSVSVGATIWNSAPLYGPDGWHVLASPNGSLVTTSGIVKSLFWDGLGRGTYPAASAGRVVPSGQALATIQTDLAAQGLNPSEIRDFVDFWGSKLPTNKPYTRLSWLTKSELDTLAPLRISPRPDTTIRVFLDFEGLDTPTALTPQILSAPSRSGFTAVEWGGLLQGLQP